MKKQTVEEWFAAMTPEQREAWRRLNAERCAESEARADAAEARERQSLRKFTSEWTAHPQRPGAPHGYHFTGAGNDMEPDDENDHDDRQAAAEFGPVYGEEEPFGDIDD